MTGISALRAAQGAADSAAAATRSGTQADAGLFSQLLKARLDTALMSIGTEAGPSSGASGSLLNMMLIGSMLQKAQPSTSSEEIARMQQELEELKQSQTQKQTQPSAARQGGLYISRVYTPDSQAMQVVRPMRASAGPNRPQHTAVHDAVCSTALTRIGDPYSQSRRGQGAYVDCSYLTQWAYAQHGISIPSIASEQARWCVEKGYVVPQNELQAGDLVFWTRDGCSCGRYDEIHHVGMYLGNGRVLEASSSQGKVVINDLWEELDETPWHVAFYARPAA